MRGPATEPSDAIEMVNPTNVGLLLNGAAAFTMLRHPLIKPAPPIPATARPTMNMVEPFAVAQISDPSSKTARNARNEYFEEAKSTLISNSGH